MDKAILERRLHLTVTFIGGFMGCYAIFNRCDVFGSAQTGNLISFVMDLTGHSDPHMFFRFSALLIYIFAMVATVFLSHKLQKTTLKFVSLLIDALAFLLLGFLPEDMDPFIALYPVFFCHGISVVFLQRCRWIQQFLHLLHQQSPSVHDRICRIPLQQRLRGTSKGNFLWKSTSFFLSGSCSMFPVLSEISSHRCMGRTSPCMCCTCTRQ